MFILAYYLLIVDLLCELRKKLSITVIFRSLLYSATFYILYEGVKFTIVNSIFVTNTIPDNLEISVLGSKLVKIMVK